MRRAYHSLRILLPVAVIICEMIAPARLAHARAAAAPLFVLTPHCIVPPGAFSILGSHLKPNDYVLLGFDHLGKKGAEGWSPIGGLGYTFKTDADGNFEQTIRLYATGPVAAPLGTTDITVFATDPRSGYPGFLDGDKPLAIQIQRSCPSSVPLAVSVTYTTALQPPAILVSVSSVPHARLLLQLTFGGRQIQAIKASVDKRGHYNSGLIRVYGRLPVDVVAIVRAAVGRRHAIAFTIRQLSLSG